MEESMIKRFAALLCVGLTLLGGAAWADTAETAVVPADFSKQFAGRFLKEGEAPVVEDMAYRSQDVSIEIKTYREMNSDVYVADIYLRHLSDLRRGFGGGAWNGRNQKQQRVVDIALQENAILALTGDNAHNFSTGIVYVNKKSEPEIGGGICQVATGCYQAALKAGMEITERSEHMYLVTYCSPALDATVYWGSLDLRFRNPWTMPIRVNASVSGGQVHISIDGTNFTGHYITLSYAHVGGLSYRGYKTIHNPDGSELETIDLGVSNYSSH